MRVIESARRLVKAGLGELGASSAIFYVRDPWWDDAYQLVLMEGVRYEEPMYGLFRPKPTDSLSPREGWFSDARSAEVLRDSQWLSLERIVEGNRWLFGSFAEREAVQSCARLCSDDGDGRVLGILYVNFGHTTTFPREEQRRLRSMALQLMRLAPDIANELRRENSGVFGQLIAILRPLEGLLRPNLRQDKARFQRCLDQLLEAALSAFGISRDSGFGTIHLYDPETNTLNLRAMLGSRRHREAPASQAVATGQGVISWVAIRRCSLLIRDIARSPFRAIHVPVGTGIQSELAVPMVAGDELLGVVNLESVRGDAFPAAAVQALWQAANQAALALQVSDAVERQQKFLQICHDVSFEPKNAERHLQPLAKHMRHSLGASKCDLWEWDQSASEFRLIGASYDGVDTDRLPRSSGWSLWIRENRTPVWIFDVHKPSDFQVRFWNSGTQEWTSQANQPFPDKVNQRLFDLRVRGELGLPIPIGSRSIGVAWLKFDNLPDPLPSPGTMASAARFAAEVGLVIDVARHREELESHEKEESEMERVWRGVGLQTGPLDLRDSIGATGFVINRPMGGRIGGDFCDVIQLGDGMVGIALIDGSVHSAIGALHMLPLATAFRSCVRELRSTKEVLIRVDRAARAMKVRGTGLYCILSRDDRGLTAFASCAAHQPLVVIRRRPTSRLEVLPSERLHNLGSLGDGDELQIGEDKCTLNTGDVLFACTDGVWDASRNRHAEAVFELCGKISSLLENPEAAAKAVEKWADENGGFSDDATILVLKVEAAAAKVVRDEHLDDQPQARPSGGTASDKAAKHQGSVAPAKKSSRTASPRRPSSSISKHRDS